MLVNGREMEYKGGITISSLLNDLNLDEDKVVVEVNREIVLKKNYSSYTLHKEDKVEIVSFVGGG
ncbi:sulfur carrier protein ThiS [Thermohalobacter berrensis]|uniref:Thiamine biosynthesis protein ThiS n=1 Tax=Thermohalobacter berrensis TaxID=99594 RepID=A0A419SZD7_9FIRM|nr:sulfur carrier protein ThiS [Thermohalobacter berrensis]RKD30529.1 thiamine biosynthesis protein ThiS [Thermohalobacter berrensis]